MLGIADAAPHFPPATNAVLAACAVVAGWCRHGLDRAPSVQLRGAAAAEPNCPHRFHGAHLQRHRLSVPEIYALVRRILFCLSE